MNRNGRLQEDRRVVHLVTTSGNVWQRMMIQLVTTNYSEWQRAKTSGATNDKDWYNEWQRVTTNDNEWQQITASDSEWQQATILAKLPFFSYERELITKHLKEDHLDLRPWGEPSIGLIKLRIIGIETVFLFVIHATLKTYKYKTT